MHAQILLREDIIERSAGAPSLSVFAVAIRIDLKQETGVVSRVKAPKIALHQIWPTQ